MNNQRKATLTIVFNMETGETSVTGPLAEKDLCVRILARAIDSVIAHQPPVILPASQSLMNGNGKAN